MILNESMRIFLIWEFKVWCWLVGYMVSSFFLGMKVMYLLCEP